MLPSKAGESSAKPPGEGRFSRRRRRAYASAVAPSKIGANKCDPVLYGNYLLIHGQGEDRSYFYAHLIEPAVVDRGDRVWAGERVGAVGETGNARTVGCHLHFEIHIHGRAIDPEPALGRWDRYS
ncbi:MAG TPA: M23 family metallopeptidase [Solirubrobacterales bacterium]|nr:M23 family metallopeptidase [Solirubrobacterales bacterium]